MNHEDESDTEHSTDRRYTWLDKNGKIASRKLTSYECRLEDDVQRLQDALFSISSHYAKIQFRLRQIASSTGCERLSLLRDLEKMTREGIDATKDNNELPSLLEDSQSFGDVRLRQKKIISQLRGGLSNLMNVTDVCFPPEAECSYKSRKYQPRNAESNEKSTLEKGYLCEVWPEQPNKPRLVREDEEEDEELPRPRGKRKSKSKKKRHRKSSKNNKKSPYNNQNIYPSCILRNLMPDPLFLPSATTLSPCKTRSSRRAAKKRSEKNLNTSSSYSLSDVQKKSVDDPRFNSKYNKKTENSDAHPEPPSDPLIEMSPSFIDWTCGEPKCQEDCKCSITGNCIELKLSETVTKEKSKKSSKKESNKKNVNFLTPEKNFTQLQPKGRHSSLKSVRRALSSYFQGSQGSQGSSSRRKSASSTLVYPHAIGKPSNLCKNQSRASFRHGSSIQLSKCSSSELSDVSDLYVDKPQRIKESQL